MERLPDSSLIIGVATSTAERVQLARLLGGAEALLLVSSAEQARAFLDLTTAAESTPVVLTPAVLPAAKRDTVTAQIESLPLPTTEQPKTDLPTSGQATAGQPAKRLPTTGPSSSLPATGWPAPDLATSGMPQTGMPATVLPGSEPRSAAVAATGLPTSDPRHGSLEPPVAELSLDVERRVVRWKGREMPLTRLEHDFLHCLVEEPGRVWTYQRLHLAVWGNEFLGHGSHIHSVVKRLRQKLAELGAAVTIHAVRGVGFHLLPAA
jgi:hypothetical protein